MAYVIVREDIRNPLINTQVLNLLKKIKQQSVDIEIYLIWFFRVDYIFRGRKEINAILQEVKSNNINIIKWPVVTTKFPISLLFMPFLMLQIVIGIIFVKFIYKINIFHGRAYYAGLALALYKKLFNKKAKIIFDPRSHYPNELVIGYGKPEESIHVSIWKRLERFIVKNSDFTIAISDPFLKHLQIYGNTKFVPNNVEISNIEIFDNIKNRDALCYVGSIGNNWNNINTYLEFIEGILLSRKDIYFEFYISNLDGKNLFAEGLSKRGISEQKYIISSLKPEEVVTRIFGAIAGLQLFDKYDMRIGVKVVEYLAAGLPIITTPQVGGALEIVKKYNVGICYNNNIEEVINFIDEQIKNRLVMRKRCLELSRFFSTENVSSKYIHIYNELANS